ncbi:MAG: UDP-glucose--hexose-1-phosphate uridylyltransferase [Bacteroidota bacterium]
MTKLNLTRYPHRRQNLLTGEWVLVSPERLKRPWQGKIDAFPVLPEYDPACYLCPGNLRANGKKNPNYEHTYVFDNDFSALRPETPRFESKIGNLLLAAGEQGVCRVVCFSPKHNLTLAEMNVNDIRRVVEVWIEEYIQLGEKEYVSYVQIFENKGEIMGCSNPHPHCQIWAESSVPVEPMKETAKMLQYRNEHHSCILCDYEKIEVVEAERVVCENEHFLVVVPFWAVWPFETMIVSKRHFGNLAQMSESERTALADILKKITVRYDNLFRISFPYSAGIHQSPTDGSEHEEWHFHMHFYPPLLRSATVRKFMVGYEMLANPQRDITPEESAKRLRQLSDIHYKEGA